MARPLLLPTSPTIPTRRMSPGGPNSTPEQQSSNLQLQPIADGRKALELNSQESPARAIMPSVGFAKDAPPCTPATRLPWRTFWASRRHVEAEDNSYNLSGGAHTLEAYRNTERIEGEGHAREKGGGARRALLQSPRKTRLQAFPVTEERRTEYLLSSGYSKHRKRPAVDLWKRYAVNATVNDKGSSESHTHVNSIHKSSPKSSANTGSVSGLRRWASCGIEWPTSRSKRRRMTKGFNAKTTR